jgi:5-formyltetrahydrofolate cyclo-ligase
VDSVTELTDLADAAAIAAAKRVLRGAVRLRRDARSEAQRLRDDEHRFNRLREAMSTRPPRRLAAYLSTGTEPDSLRLIAWSAAHGVEVLLPVLTDGAGSWLPHPAWARYEGPERLREGRSHILEPTGPVLVDDPLAIMDVMVVPGLAADANGNRLGRGGGWYDRARLAHPELETWLLLNDDEVLDVVPADAWDLPVDRLVTPIRVITAVPEAAPPT